MTHKREKMFIDYLRRLFWQPQQTYKVMPISKSEQGFDREKREQINQQPTSVVNQQKAKNNKKPNTYNGKGRLSIWV